MSDDYNIVSLGNLEHLTALVKERFDSTVDAAEEAKTAAIAAKQTINALAEVAKTGSYNDLENKPTILTTSEIETIASNAVPKRTYRFFQQTTITNITLPAGHYKITLVGGGGGASGGANNIPTAGAGAGAICIWNGELDAGTYVYSVGGGGTGIGNAAPGTPQNGVSTIFNFGTGSLTAGGGFCPTARTANAAGGAGGSVSANGTIPGSYVSINGQIGKPGAASGNTLRTGDGGSTIWGIGGNSVTGSNAAGQAGLGYGSGGSGALGTANGGNGAPGCLIIESV